MIKWNSGLVGEMLVLFTVAIASGVEFFGEEKADKGRSSHADKTPKQRDSKHKTASGRISSSMKLSYTPNKEAQESYSLNYGEGYKEDFKDNTAQLETGTDYEEEWLTPCSLRQKGRNSLYRKKKHLRIPGCGGSASLACPKGCLDIHKVFT